MARFLAYQDITTRDPPSRADIQWLAAQIAALPPFVSGAAVVCGSVSWGTHSWRSDIDIAHFRTRDHPAIEADIEKVLSDFHHRTGHKFITPRIDIAVIGEESPDVADKAEQKRREQEAARKKKRKQKELEAEGNFSLGGPPTSLELLEQTTLKIFADAVERFGDHIGCIAALKGQPWTGFFERYLSQGRRTAAEQREAISGYVNAVSGAWSQQPLHPLNRGPDGEFTARQLGLLGQAENYPVNLMRRLLAAQDKYPRPDRISDIKSSFSELPDAWARTIVAALPAFTALSEQYESLVEACRQPDGKPSAQEFHERIELAAAHLPFDAIQEAVWEYLRT
jgi:hypothetical protein